MGIILDSSIVIAAERRGNTVAELIEHVVGVAGDQGAALSAIALTEFIHGIHRAQTPETRQRREAFLKELLMNLTVHPFTTQTAVVAGRVDAEQRAQGVVVPFADLLIGATALSLGFSVITANPRHFRLIPGLAVLQL